MNRTLNNREGMYNFHYKPIGLGKLSVYDASPLIFILDIVQGMVLGVNIHWIPKASRQQFLDDAIEIIGKTIGRAKKKERIRLIYTMLKKPKFRQGLQAVRRYSLLYMTSIQEIPRSRWNQVLGLPQFQSDKRLKSNNYKKK